MLRMSSEWPCCCCAMSGTLNQHASGCWMWEGQRLRMLRHGAYGKTLRPRTGVLAWTRRRPREMAAKRTCTVFSPDRLEFSASAIDGETAWASKAQMEAWIVERRVGFQILPEAAKSRSVRSKESFGIAFYHIASQSGLRPFLRQFRILTPTVHYK